MAELNPIEFFKSLGIQPSSGDVTETIFRAAQLAQSNRERQRQAIQGVVDTFLTVSKLNMEKERMKMEQMVAQATIDLNNRKFQQDQEEFKLAQQKALGEIGLGPLADVEAVFNPNTGKMESLGPGRTFKGSLPTMGGMDGRDQKLSEAYKKALRDTLTIQNQIESLFKQSEEAGVPSGLFLGMLKKSALALYPGLVPELASVESQRGIFEGLFAKSIGKEAGNLTLYERQSASKLFPNPTDTPILAKRKLEALRTLTQNTIEVLKNTQSLELSQASSANLLLEIERAMLSNAPMPQRGKKESMSELERQLLNAFNQD